MLIEPLITKKELAKRLHVSLACLDRWIRTRRIPFYRLGSRCIRFDYAQVREALQKFEITALRRFPRFTYRQRRNRITESKVCQLNLPLDHANPNQQVFSFFDAPTEEMKDKGLTAQD